MMNTITAKVAGVATLTVASLASVATAKAVNDDVKKHTSSSDASEKVKTRQCDLSKGTEDVRDLDTVDWRR
jgi:uncharacterized low-complexity protein